MGGTWKTGGWMWNGASFLCGNFCEDCNCIQNSCKIFVEVLRKIVYFFYNKQVPIYIAEITPKNLRGGFTTVHQVKLKNLETS